MAPEPLRLAGIVKNCPSCGSTDVKYVYNNSDQPRYLCLVSSCSTFFTYEGKLRGSQGGGRRPKVPAKSPPGNPIGIAGDRSTRIGKPHPGAVPAGVRRRVRRSLNVVRQSEPFEVEEILGEDAVGVVGGGAAIGGVAPSEEVPKRKVPESAAGSSDGALLEEQRNNPSKTLQEGADAKVWVKANLGISGYGLVPAAQSKQLKRIRVKHQERESVIEYRT